MRAIVIHAAHDLRIDEMPEDGPGPGQVLVDIGYGGICGSDLHYFNHGGFGAVRVREPMILGHEVAGTVAEVGPGVDGLAPGDHVAVNPSRPCGTCRFCREAMFNQCLDMRFYGSAMRMPHVQGAFRERLVADAGQCFKISPDVSLQEAAMAEPLSVAAHAVSRAGVLIGRVLVTGCGPIGALTVIAARAQGAGEITVSDIVDEPLERAAAVGADRTLNVATHPDALEPFKADKGMFDAVFECSGNPRAMATALQVIRPGGAFVQVGLFGGDVELPVNLIVAKEIRLCGSFRFHEEFAYAAELISSGRVDLKPLITGVFPLSEAQAAFEAAGDRKRSMKVQIAFA